MSNSMGKLTVLLAFFCWVSIAGVTQADAGVSYSYAELSGSYGDAQGIDTKGYVLEASVALNEMIFVGAGYRDTRLDTSPSSDAQLIRMGIGARYNRNPEFSAYLLAAYARVDLSLVPANAVRVNYDQSGVMTEVGVRGLLGEYWEYLASAYHADFADRGLGFRVGGLRHIKASPWSVGLFASGYDNEWDQLELSLRYRFD